MAVVTSESKQVSADAVPDSGCSQGGPPWLTDARLRHHRSMATTTAPPESTETPAPAPADNRFFTWIRSLGLTRQPGWIGGVSAGIAARLGIDPLIVRGVLVVVAVLGGPALLLYAAAWLLLPDASDKIHLEQLLRGRLESPIAAIGAIVLLSLLPLAQGFWYTGALYWGEPSWGDSVGRVLWTLVVLGLVVWFVIWIARRAERSGSPVIIPATTDDRPDTVPQPIVDVEPTAPAADASTEDVAAWRIKQDAWKSEREAFRAEAAAGARETARLRAVEARERSAAASAARVERRRRWRAANPPAGAAFTAIALGGAAIAGALGSLLAPAGAQVIAVGLATSAMFLGLSMVVAGLLRRRSGFVSFLSVLLLLGALGAAAVPADRVLVTGSYGISNYADGRYFSPVGSLYVTLDPSFAGSVVDVVQGAGTIDVRVPAGMTVRVEIDSTSGEVWLAHPTTAYTRLAGQSHTDGTWQSTTTFGTAPEPDVVVHIRQASGSIVLFQEDDPTASTTPETPMETAP